MRARRVHLNRRRRAVIGLTGSLVLALLATATLTAEPEANGATTEWQSMSMPFLKPGSDQLASVSCPSVSVKFCMAVGSTASPPQNSQGDVKDIAPLAEVWTGGAWKVTKTPNPYPPESYFESVSCSSPTFCMALLNAGEYVELWNGSAWSIGTSPPPDGTSFTSLTSIACWSDECVAVGLAAAPTDVPYAELWNGESWQAVPPNPPPSGFRGQLFDVSCDAPAQCLASGETSNNQTNEASAQLFSGGTWSDETPPASPHEQSLAVGCAESPAPVSCMMVGTPYDSAQTTPVAEVWNASTGTWEETPPAVPSPPRGTELYSYGFSGVACPATNECVATGSFDTGTTTLTNRLLIEMWSGSGWSQMKTSSALNSLDLGAVSCPTTTFCVTVGLKGLLANDTAPAAASWGTAP